MKTILILNESSVQKPFTSKAVAGKEALLRAQIPTIERIVIISLPPSQSLAPQQSSTSVVPQILVLHTLPWPYYFSTFILFLYGLFACLKYRPSWVEAESPLYSGLSAILLGKLFRLKTIIEIRSDFQDLARYRTPWIPLTLKQLPIKIIQNLVITQATALIANSYQYARQFIPEKKPHLIVNPGLKSIDVPTYNTKPTTFKLGYIGRLVPEKGVKLLLQAIKILVTQKNTPAFHLSIAGAGPELKSLNLLTDQLELKKYISFLGFQPNLHFISRCHLIINPCLVNAPLEMVNAEAALMGIPVICFGQGSNPETVVDRQTGLKVAQKNPRALASAITTFLTQPKLRQTLHQNAPPFAEANYSFDLQVKKLFAFYRSQQLL